MVSSAKIFLLLGSFNALLVVVLGAFGAHMLKTMLSEDMMAIYHTGIQYHLYHALGLLVVGLLANQLPSSHLIKWAGWIMCVGILLFSGSLYALSLTSTRWLGAITPLGGTAFLVSWVIVMVSVIQRPSRPPDISHP